MNACLFLSSRFVFRLYWCLLRGRLNERYGWKQNADCQLIPIGGGHWAGFFPGLADGDEYLFFVEGTGTSDYKRDPYGRVLSADPAFPGSRCLLRDPARFPWHDTGFRPPAFNDVILYQLHVGTYAIPAGRRDGTFLDVAGKIPYLASLGVNAIEPLPVCEVLLPMVSRHGRSESRRRASPRVA